MMISPQSYIEQQKDKTYSELLKERDKLEENAIETSSPDVVYQCHLEYLSRLCLLICEKFNKEYKQ